MKTAHAAFTERRTRRARRTLRELSAGLTVSAGSIPNELSYGLLAFAPLGAAMEGRGVLAAMLAGMAGSMLALLFGSRKGQIHGARPALALIVSGLVGQALVQGHWLPGIPLDAAALILLALLLAGAAILQLAAAAAGWGRFVRYVPYPVQAGFFNGVALLMVVGGFKLVFLQNGSHWPPDFWPALVAACTFVPGWLAQRRWPGVPVLPLALVCGAVLHHGLSAAGLPAGNTLGMLSGAHFGFEHLALLPQALALHDAGAWARLLGGSCVAIALVSSLETLFAASRLDTLTHSRHDTRHELAAVGATNLVLSALGALPGAGAVSRANAAHAAGGRGRLPAMVYAAMMMLACLFGMDLLALLPRATVGAGLILMALSVADQWTVQTLRQLLTAQPLPARRRLVSNLAVSMGVMLVAVLVGLLEAVSAGLVGAMFLFARDHSKRIVRRIADGSKASSLLVRPGWQQAELTRRAGLYALVELEGMLFFGTAEELEEALDMRLPSARHIVLDAARLVDIDLSGAQSLARITLRLRGRHTEIALAGMDPAGPRSRFLRASGLADALPRERWFATVDAALEWAENRVLEGAGHGKRSGECVTLDQMELCAGLSPAQLQALDSLLKPRHFGAGEHVFHAGDASDAMYFLMRGSVSVLRSRADGSAPVRLACLSAGLVVGEMGLIENQPRTADGRADTSVDCLVLDRPGLEQLQREHPQLSAQLFANLARTLAHRLRNTTGQLHALLQPY